MVNGAILNINELSLGDVVKSQPENDAPFNELTVTKKDRDGVRFFRTYTTLADFEYTGGVISYIGTETFEVPLSSPATYRFIANIFRKPA